MVTNEQVLALQSLLASDAATWTRNHQRLLEDDLAEGYGELVYATFVLLARRRFSSTWRLADVVRYVADVRVRLDAPGDPIDPFSAEILIRRALGDTVTGDLDQETRARTQLILMISLAEDETLADRELDSTLSQARAMADQLIEKREATR